jgi:PPK2 family polyphosphate:nucleotide phosphotransferase
MDTERFRVAEGSKVDLRDHPTDYTGEYKEKDDAVKDLEKNIKELTTLQETLYAENRRSLLIVFQAMDAAGKDSAIEHVMSGINPQGCRVTSFKSPSTEELDHDYLWRCHKEVPTRGMIGIFNRSHYEEVLVVKVHPQYLASQRLPDGPETNKDFWKDRYRQIRDWEAMLEANGTHIIKFFLHVSLEEQKQRFLDRINEPDKNWKFSAGDAKERAYWDDYMKAYEDALAATSTDASPWYVIPADKKWFARLAVSEVIVDAMNVMKLRFPEVTEEMKADLIEAKTILESERPG